MIKFDNVQKSFKCGFSALKGLDFNVDAGEMIFLTGHSGAGKSTVLRLLTGEQKSTSGEVILQNTSINKLRRSQIAKLRRKIGVVFQDPRLIADQNLFHNVALPLYITEHPKKEIAQRVRLALDKVGLLSKEALKPHQLSLGEQQRAGIARAVVNKPVILLADEPTGNLDPGLSKEVMQLFYDFNKAGVTVIVATHDVHLIENYPARVLVLKSGKIIADEVNYA